MRKQNNILVLMSLICLDITGAYAQSAASHGWVFRENKGQLTDEKYSANTFVKYYGYQDGVYIYCKPGTISLVFAKSKSDDQVSEATGELQQPAPDQVRDHGLNDKKVGLSCDSKLAFYKADLVLIGANTSASITATDQQSYYENYYTTGNNKNGITNVHTYKTITYKNIYPFIDLVLHAKENGMKYEFVVNPGGDVNAIQLKWDGLQNIKSLKNGGISYELPTACGTLNGEMESSSPSFSAFTESAPICFSKTSSGHVAVSSSFSLHGSRISFSTAHYDKTKTLVIDPDLIWGNYYGGSGDNVGQGITSDANNNIYVTGYTTSKTGIATKGAYQASLAGQSDAFVSKFTPSGNLSWTTYYGGSGYDYGYGIATIENYNIIVTGWTESTNGIATAGAYQKSLSGGSGHADAFIAKFDSSGSLKWGTYYGGSNNDYGRAVTVDSYNNIYITGETSSTNGIATSGAYQSSFAGDEDAFVAKFSSSGSLSWGTYYGGAKDDWGLGITHDAADNIYITGYTLSKKGIATSGAYQTKNAGGNNFGDAFVAKFTSAGSLDWGTYYGGSSDEEGYGITADAANNIYITGYTESASGIATTGAYQTSYAGGHSDVFVAKFTSAGSLDWGTYYGGNGDDIGEGISTDANNNVFFTGYTNSTNNIATNGTYSAKPAGIFVAKFTSSGSLYWGTYYGGSIGYSIIAGANNNEYITGTYQKNLSSNNNVLLAKFHNYNNDASLSSIVSPSSKICQGSSVVSVQLKNTGNFILSTDSIYLKINKGPQTGIKWTGKLMPDSSVTVSLGAHNFSASFENGNDTIIVRSAKPNGIMDSFPGNDTARSVVNTNPLPSASMGNNNTICSGASEGIGTKKYPGTKYSWVSNPVGFSSTLSNPKVSPTHTTTYYLYDTILSTGCGNSGSVVISVDNSPVANAGKDQAICSGKSTIIGATPISGLTYSWTSRPWGYNNISANPSVSPSVTTAYYLFATNTCGSKSDSVLITVNPNPVANAGTNNSICLGNSTSIGGAKVNGDSYSWSSSSGGRITDTTASTIVSPTVTTTYYLSQTNTKGCKATGSVIVTINKLPEVSAGSNLTVQEGSDSFMLKGFNPKGGKWHGSGVNIMGMFNPSVAGIDTLTYSFTNASGCSDSASIIIKVNPEVKNADAGIDEILSPLGSILTDKYPVIVQIKNFGLPVLSSACIHWMVNNKLQPVYNWKGQLIHDSSNIITLNPGFDFTQPGVYVIKAWTSNPDSSIDINHQNDTAEVTTSIFTTAIEQTQSETNNLKLWYSSDNEKAHIQLSSENERQLMIRLTDIQGKVLHSFKFSLCAGINQTQIDMSAYSAGVYLVFINGNAITDTRKIIKE